MLCRKRHRTLIVLSPSAAEQDDITYHIVFPSPLSPFETRPSLLSLLHLLVAVALKALLKLVVAAFGMSTGNHNNVSLFGGWFRAAGQRSLVILFYVAAAAFLVALAHLLLLANNPQLVTCFPYKARIVAHYHHCSGKGLEGRAEGLKSHNSNSRHV